MLGRSLSICLGLFWTVATLHVPANAETLYVYSPLLPIHKGASLDDTEVHILDYGDKVTLVREETPTSPQPQEWAKIEVETEANRVVGYARTEALLPIPAPDVSQSGFAALTNRLTKSGPARTERSADITTERQSFKEGVTLATRIFHTPYGDFKEQTVTVSDITVSQGFLLARAIVNQDGIDSEHMGRSAKVETDEDGMAFIFDEDYWQIISITETQDGVQISFPERAD